jgi:cytochrome b6-f complex iron-sulfur subunit
MTSVAIFALILVGVTIAVAFAIVAIAAGRSDSDGPVSSAELDRKAAKADRDRRKAKEAAASAAAAADGSSEGDGAVATMVAAPAEFRDDTPRVEVDYNEYGVTRRKFFNRAVGAVFGLFMLQFALASLAFIWPKLKGGFGTPIKVGNVDAIKAEVFAGASVIPKFVPAAQSWVIPFDMSKLEGSSFESTPFVVAGGESDGVGLMALWQRCVHLGCRVPSCNSSQGFECPCHGSKYNGHGEYSSGPAPRNMDRFGVIVDEAGDFIIDTGTIVQTSRAKEFTTTYPQGPFCVG